MKYPTLSIALATHDDLLSTLLTSCRQLYFSSPLHTLLLFTWTDYKTIFFPITSFASATAPVHSLSKLAQGCFWIWLHLILCNVSNQARTQAEDAVNRPWRPVPSGRITESQAYLLRWVMVGICLMWSALYGFDQVLITLGLVITTLAYDEGGLAAHWIGKNFCNIGGYTTFEMGATKIMGLRRELDHVSIMAVLLSGILIFTTIQAQDFPDVEGDMALNRITFPIYAPEFSRALTLAVMPAWSILLSWFWGIGTFSRLAYIMFGGYIGLRYYCQRDQKSDRVSYLIFNAWLVMSHLLPVHARMGVLSI